MKINKGERKIMRIILLAVIIMIVLISINFMKAVKKANKRFASYKDRTKMIETSFGKLTYLDEGRGDVILSCHGICGGYDQAFDTLCDKTNEYRILAPSRFGYPGSDIPDDPSVDNQVEAFVELLDQLKIDKIYILGTSAGGSTAINFALNHPERTKGLILYCSGYPATKLPERELKFVGPPSALCHDFPMWFFSPLFGPVMGMDKNTVKLIMPLKERHNGIVLDAQISNTVMENHYMDYDMQKLKVPVLMLHAKDDKMADYYKAAYWSEKITDCTFVSFDTGGHLMTGNTNRINQSLEEFTTVNSVL